MDDDSQGIAKLAIRIYSVIANSGANERNFSDFGNIQTKLRNRLSIEQTHKTNVVRMDIAREHARLGLATSRGKRKLGHNNEPGDTPKLWSHQPQVHQSLTTQASQRSLDTSSNLQTTRTCLSPRPPSHPLQYPLPPIDVLDDQHERASS